MAYIINMASGGITQAEAEQLLAEKQDVLVSGTNIKTVNQQSLLGSGDLVIESTTDNDE
jgi:pentose-5-phosphate-3-epimerase